MAGRQGRAERFGGPPIVASRRSARIHSVSGDVRKKQIIFILRQSVRVSIGFDSTLKLVFSSLHLPDRSPLLLLSIDLKEA